MPRSDCSLKMVNDLISDTFEQTLAFLESELSLAITENLMNSPEGNSMRGIHAVSFTSLKGVLG